MELNFYGSLCYQGLRGGAIGLNDDYVIYRNQTATLPAEYKNIVIQIKNIESVEKGRSFIFPAVTIRCAGQKKYKFVIFNRNGFLKALKQLRMGLSCRYK